MSKTAFGSPSTSAPRPSHRNESGITEIVWPSEIEYASPLPTSIMLSVTMNGGMSNTVTMRPENPPRQPHTRIAARQHSSSAPVPACVPPPKSRMKVAVSTALSAMRLPTLKSMPPAMITIVMPTATIAMMAIWFAMFSKFDAFRKVGKRTRAGLTTRAAFNAGKSRATSSSTSHRAACAPQITAFTSLASAKALRASCGVPLTRATSTTPASRSFFSTASPNAPSSAATPPIKSTRSPLCRPSIARVTASVPLSGCS